MMPDGTEVLAIVWRDNLNRTVASDVTAVVLPPLAPLAEASVQDTDHCNIGCDWRYHVSRRSVRQSGGSGSLAPGSSIATDMS